MRKIAKRAPVLNPLTILLLIAVMILLSGVAAYIYQRHHTATIPHLAPGVGCWEGADGHTICA